MIRGVVEWLIEGWEIRNGVSFGAGSLDIRLELYWSLTSKWKFGNFWVGVNVLMGVVRFEWWRIS